jgi:hypothetical protein
MLASVELAFKVVPSTTRGGFCKASAMNLYCPALSNLMFLNTAVLGFPDNGKIMRLGNGGTVFNSTCTFASNEPCTTIAAIGENTCTMAGGPYWMSK